ncbi:Glutamyl-tRNA(Gln) amidotransferase subunit A [Mycoplasmoides gallisepticum CA06_2006.052-5-2P]|uniref:Glutamyl-tRNA(Gln) amidotransferase subunit A n=1 Tax=Mycoplasmoides gallisepticum WI01_2001.043-13-2P TaxID=1159201 RepID=J3YTF5_MYCGL|nr:amidase family protein [Mycoplasmoides gallisepticum]AFP76169.1 Glutamyl-tRNA(Gln) amidotransferase subunit A [Mycoplasmoides gallisepticum VA94_7994-1-7P]AFP76936.1 Glutamyl-tRNA(Gln) amidotransferase subunit A [Mycoplasmoides gallisepticum NC95_13295-2-2P]AFP77694.1 Glutamyl-tRNA(Gln) amidotransferase subunit A [Mycoplasmoides gallisepticum NC96_1596-4-2P]AFP78461.1 Glutamyl-tRNA(Gln) amidotransferase subunit A [Mycoplasmoides gallisepticum NY01_2001.047-5-1P]AFP79221.1 Glutamyl-tRNA(Gln)
MKSDILKFNTQLRKKEITPDQLVKDSLKLINKYHWTNAYLYVNEQRVNEKVNNFDHNIVNNSLLAYIPYSLKDNISTKGITTTGGSRFLEHYIPPYDATVYKILENLNALMVAKVNMDEFGLGGTGLYSGFGYTHHPISKKYAPGGSSSGSAISVANNSVVFSVATDTGDSVRRPASLVGIVGFKPTYGSISRYGVYPYAPSMDHVAIFTRNVTDVAIVTDALSQFDPKDFTSQKRSKSLLNHLLEPDLNQKKIRLGYYKNLEPCMYEDILTAWKKVIDFLYKTNKFEIVELEFDIELLKAVLPTYQILSFPEANSCYANLTGIPFGEKVEGESYEQKVINARTKLLGNQIKRRFTIGAYITLAENYEPLFKKAQKARRMIVDHFEQSKKDVDVVFGLGASNFAAAIEDYKQGLADTNLIDDFLSIANFGGHPSITIPMIKNRDNLTVGLNLVSNQFNDDLIIKTAYLIETELDKNGGNINA